MQASDNIILELEKTGE
jgi:hypothetical protein